MKCVAKEGSYGMNVCQDEREDYMECLHHTKLVSGPYTNTCACVYTDASMHLYIQQRRLETIQLQKEKLIKEGKWPPKDS